MNSAKAPSKFKTSIRDIITGIQSHSNCDAGGVKVGKRKAVRSALPF